MNVSFYLAVPVTQPALLLKFIDVDVLLFTYFPPILGVH